MDKEFIEIYVELFSNLLYYASYSEEQLVKAGLDRSYVLDKIKYTPGVSYDEETGTISIGNIKFTTDYLKSIEDCFVEYAEGYIRDLVESPSDFVRLFYGNEYLLSRDYMDSLISEYQVLLKDESLSRKTKRVISIIIRIYGSHLYEDWDDDYEQYKYSEEAWKLYLELENDND